MSDPIERISVRNIFISPQASIGEDVILGDGVQIFGPAEIGAGSWIDVGVVIGYPGADAMLEARRRSKTDPAREESVEAVLERAVTKPTALGPESFIRRGSIIYEGCSIGARLDCAHHVIVREDCELDEDVELGPLSYLKRECKVGAHSRIAAEICDRTVVGKHCTVYGRTIHKFLGGVSGVLEEAPVLEDGVVVGRDACVVGPIVVGRLSLVGAGSMVTRSVPPETVVAGNPARFLRKRAWTEATELWARVEKLKED